MRFVKAIVVFFVVFLAYHIFFGCTIFQADEIGVLVAPAWYPIVGFIIALIPAYFVSKKKANFTKKSFCGSGDGDIAARAILKHGTASVAVIQKETGWKPQRASRALEVLEKIGAVGPINDDGTREIFIDK